MKRFALREFLFLCAPIALVGIGITAVRLLNPPRDPDARIALTVARNSGPHGTYGNGKHNFNFDWQADAQGGPKNDIQLLYTQKLVASGHGRSQVLFQEPATGTVPVIDGLGFGGGSNVSSGKAMVSQNMNIPYRGLPIWTEKLSWSGDVVAIPQDAPPKWAGKVGNPATFATLARIKGAARATVTLPVTFNAKRLQPLQSLELQPVNPSNAAKGADTCVATQFRDGERSVYARLVAFDGKNYRPLWNNATSTDSDYWIAAQGSGISPIWRDYHLFKLRDVPPQWGEIIYIVDAAFNPDAGKIFGNFTNDGAAEIERLKRAGWLHFSKRLTVRKAGTQIQAVNYPKTPNTQFISAQTSVVGKNWVIKARLKYSGPKLGPEEELDSPQGPEFYEADGKYVSMNRLSYGINNKGAQPGEYLATVTVPLKSVGQPRPLVMKMEVADARAAPLHFEAKLMVPKTPG